MAVFHYVHLRAFAHETEDPARVAAALRHAAQDERLEVRETRAEGSHGNRILLLDAELKSGAAAKRMFGALRRDDPRGFDQVAQTTRERLDENLNFHLRLDKQEAYLGRVALTQGDDAITVRGKIRSFESKRSGAPIESALSDVDAFLLGVAGKRDAVLGQ